MGSSTTPPEEEPAPARPEAGTPDTETPAEPSADAAVAADRWPRRAAFWLGVAALAALVAGAAWIAVTGVLARSQLNQVRAELPRLRQAVLDGRVDVARELAERIGTQTRRAHSLTTGPAWWVGANLPVIGSPLHTVRVIAASGDELGTAVVPTVVGVADEFERLRPHDSSIDLRPVERLAPALHRCAEVVAKATGRMEATGGSWFGPVSSARGTLLRQLERIDGELSGADRAVHVAIPLLGGDGPRRIFIGFLNEAEARPQGGITGQYAVVSTDAGRVHFDHFGSDQDLKGVRADVSLDAEYTAMFGQDDPTGVVQNANVSPDFRDAARIWAGMWQAKTGQRIDAAISLDPTALGYLLSAAGPATLPGGHRLRGSEVVALTEKDVYTQYTDRTKRKAYLSMVARAASERLLAAHHLAGIARAAGRAGRESRMMIWSADPHVEALVLGSRYAGTPPAGPAPVAGFLVTNATGSKLDYYLDRAMTYRQHGCGRAATAEASFRVTNRAPTGLPAYVTVRSDDRAAGAAPGDSRLLITYYAGPGTRIVDVRVDGRVVQTGRQPLRGLTAATVDVELPRGATSTVSVRVSGGGDGAVRIMRQPLVRPLAVELSTPHCA